MNQLVQYVSMLASLWSCACFVPTKEETQHPVHANHSEVIQPVYFELGSSTIAEVQFHTTQIVRMHRDSVLLDLYDFIIKKPEVIFCFIGCYDSTEDSKIGPKRAAYLRDQLVLRGVAKGRIELCPFDMENSTITEQQIASLPTEKDRADARRVNARVDIVVANKHRSR